MVATETKVTGEQVKAAMIAKGVNRVDCHQCAICNEIVSYQRLGDQLYFDSACGCAYSEPTPRTWDEAASWINMQSNPFHRGRIMRAFGIPVEAAQ